MSVRPAELILHDAARYAEEAGVSMEEAITHIGLESTNFAATREARKMYQGQRRLSRWANLWFHGRLRFSKAKA